MWNQPIFREVPACHQPLSMIQNSRRGSVRIQVINFEQLSICDGILRNQSEVEHVTFLVFYLIEVLIWRGAFC